MALPRTNRITATPNPDLNLKAGLKGMNAAAPPDPRLNPNPNLRAGLLNTTIEVEPVNKANPKDAHIKAGGTVEFKASDVDVEVSFKTSPFVGEISTIQIEAGKTAMVDVKGHLNAGETFVYGVKAPGAPGFGWSTNPCVIIDGGP